MSQAMVAAYVETLLEELIGNRKISSDADGAGRCVMAS